MNNLLDDGKDGDGGDEDVEMNGGEDDTSKVDVADVFVQHTLLRTPGKARSVHWATAPTSSKSKSKSVQLVISTTNNLIEM